MRCCLWQTSIYGHLSHCVQQWVSNGGTLFGAVGMDLLNQFNQTNTDLAALYGISVPYAILGAGEAGPGSGEISFVKQVSRSDLLDMFMLCDHASDPFGDQ